MMQPTAVYEEDRGDEHDGDVLIPPVALSMAAQLEIMVQAFVDGTPYLRSELNTDQGLKPVHPGEFIMNNLKQVKHALFTTYGEEMWQASLEGNATTRSDHDLPSSEAARGDDKPQS